ncbi:MAG TPA: RHS repeat-associated core domain-containing protein [Tepidisphaeraceae bacterium]|nr:RHS repeat-associated core domain-containing protein [Tepidisphaeraceae bacterium]
MLGTSTPIVTTYGYDLNGSLIEKTTAPEDGSATEHIKYRYDLQNHLIGLDANADESLDDPGDVKYGYDEDGIRTSKIEITTTGSTQTLYLNDKLNPTGYSQVLEEKASATSTPLISYVLGEDVISQNSGGVSSFLLYDGHGSTRALTDNTGNITERYDYDAFGRALIAALPSTKLLYSGEWYDADLNEYYLRARYYDLGIGRFSSFDPFVAPTDEPLALHKYVYVQNEPPRGIDPTGLTMIADPLIAQGETAHWRALNGTQTIQQGNVLAAMVLYAIGFVWLQTMRQPTGPTVPIPPPPPRPPRASDECQVMLGLVPGINDRKIQQRPAIQGNLTVDYAVFRLDGGIPAPIGQSRSRAATMWARSIGNNGMAKDDAGHVIGRQFGGTTFFNSPFGNIFPQELRSNRVLLNQYDGKVATLHASGCDVCVSIKLSYTCATATRPNAIFYFSIYRPPGAGRFQLGPIGLIPNP